MHCNSTLNEGVRLINFHTDISLLILHASANLPQHNYVTFYFNFLMRQETKPTCIARKRIITTFLRAETRPRIQCLGQKQQLTCQTVGLCYDVRLQRPMAERQLVEYP